jgi:DNA mismatch repair ATPase MutS
LANSFELQLSTESYGMKTTESRKSASGERRKSLPPRNATLDRTDDQRHEIMQDLEHDGLLADIRHFASYIGCLNLQEELEKMAATISFPVPASLDVRRHSCTGLYDVCLALTISESVVSNDLSADDKDLVIITGADQGGKSTFLRSIGVAQLMMQSEMFVGVKAFCANICEALHAFY